MAGRQKMRDEDDLEQVVFDDEDAGLARSRSRSGRGQPGRGQPGASGSVNVHASTQMMRKIRSLSPRSTSTACEGETVDLEGGGNEPGAASTASTTSGSRSRGGRQRTAQYTASRTQKWKGGTNKAETEIFTEFEELEAEALAARNNQVNAASSPDSVGQEAAKKGGSPSPTITSSTTKLPRKQQKSRVSQSDGRASASPTIEVDNDYHDGGKGVEKVLSQTRRKKMKVVASEDMDEEDKSRAGSRKRSAQASTHKSKSAAPSDRAPVLTKTGGQPELGRPSSWGRPAKKAAAPAKPKAKAAQKGRDKSGVSASRPSSSSSSSSPSATDIDSKHQERAKKLRRSNDVDPSNPDFFGNIPIRASTREDRATKRSHLERSDTIIEEAGTGFGDGTGETVSGATAVAPGYGSSSFSPQTQPHRHHLHMSQQDPSRPFAAPPPPAFTASASGSAFASSSSSSSSAFGASFAYGFGSAAPPPNSSPPHRKHSLGGGRSHAGAKRGWGAAARVPEGKHRAVLAGVARKAVDRPTKFYFYQAQGPRSLDMADPRNLAATYVDVMLLRRETLVDPPLMAYLAYVLPEGVVSKHKQLKKHSPVSSPLSFKATGSAGAEEKKDGDDDASNRPAFLAAPTPALDNSYVYAIFRAARDAREDKLVQSGIYRVYDPVVKWVTVAGDQHSTGPEEWRSKITIPTQPSGTGWGVTEPVHFPCLFAVGLLERNNELRVEETRVAAVKKEAEWWPAL